MDPLSITSSVLRITGSCVSAAHTLWEIRNAWKRAPVTVSTLCSQLKLTAASLSQIQSLLLGDTDVLRNKPDLVETFDTTLTSCLVLSKLLEDLVRKIKKGALEGARATWKTKFKTIWNENETKELQQQLSTQQDGISVLVNLLQMGSISDIRRLVQRHEALLQQIATNTRELRKSHSVDAPASILGTGDAGETVFSQLIDSKDGDSDGYETVILNTKVYSNAFSGVLDLATGDEQSNHARTIVDADFANRLISSEPRNLAIATRNHFEESNLAVNAPEIHSSIQNLKVTSTEAYTACSYAARSAGELSFDEDMWIVDIQQLTKQRYHGQLEKDEFLTGLCGQFSRNQVILLFRLSRALRVRTAKACHHAINDSILTYEEGEILEVDELRHGFLWYLQSPRQDESVGKVEGWAWVCDVELGEAAEKDLDQLLDFFSCPLPSLASLSKEQQSTKLRRIDWDKEQLHKYVAHCSSFKDLQYLALRKKQHLSRIWKKQKSST